MGFTMTFRKLVFFALCVVFASACNSKFVETSPGSIKINGQNLDQRLQQKQDIDLRINTIEKAADKIKRIIEIVSRVLNSEARIFYTPIDFVLDMNTELKTKIPENLNDTLVRKAVVTLPDSVATKECKLVYTMLRDHKISKLNSSSNNEVKGTRLIYSVKTCTTNDEYKDILAVDVIDSSLELSVNQDNLKLALNELVATTLQEKLKCNLVKDEKDIVEEIGCSNLEIKLSDVETANVEYVIYKNSGDVRFESRATILKNGLEKAQSLIKLYDNGNLETSLENINNDNRN